MIFIICFLIVMVLVVLAIIGAVILGAKQAENTIYFNEFMKEQHNKESEVKNDNIRKS